MGSWVGGLKGGGKEVPRSAVCSCSPENEPTPASSSGHRGSTGYLVMGRGGWEEERARPFWPPGDLNHISQVFPHLPNTKQQNGGSPTHKGNGGTREY